MANQESQTSTWCPPPPSTAPVQDRRQLIDSRNNAGSDSICHTGQTPLGVTGLIRNQLTAHFSAPSFIENPNLKSLIWQDGPRTSIMIESAYRYLPEMADKRPAVLIKRNAYTNLRIGRGDLVGADTQGNYNYQTLTAPARPAKFWRPKCNGR